MHRIWIYVMAFIGGIVAACSNDVTGAHDENNSSSDTDFVIIELSSSSKSSSSTFFHSNKTDIFFFIKSSSSTEPSSSSKEKSPSSSSKTAKSSSSSKEISSSSEPPESSSSANKPKSSASLRFYDCDKYDCVTLDYLNPEISYGELLDKRDNKVYRTLFISNHIWTAQNMNYAVETDPSTSWCYNKKSENCKKYGRFYTWEAAQKACPEGWHLPTVDDWKELLEEQSCHTERLDDGTWAYDCAGTKLKATDSWDSKEEERENALGFSVTGAGILFDETDVGLNEATFFWSATDTLSLYAFAALFQDNENTTLLGATEKENGYSVRCIKGKAE